MGEIAGSIYTSPSGRTGFFDSMMNLHYRGRRISAEVYCDYEPSLFRKLVDQLATEIDRHEDGPPG